MPYQARVAQQRAGEEQKDEGVRTEEQWGPWRGRQLSDAGNGDAHTLAPQPWNGAHDTPGVAAATFTDSGAAPAVVAAAVRAGGH